MRRETKRPLSRKKQGMPEAIGVTRRVPLKRISFTGRNHPLQTGKQPSLIMRKPIGQTQTTHIRNYHTKQELKRYFTNFLNLSLQLVKTQEKKGTKHERVIDVLGQRQQIPAAIASPSLSSRVETIISKTLVRETALNSTHYFKQFSSRKLVTAQRHNRNIEQTVKRLCETRLFQDLSSITKKILNKKEIKNLQTVLNKYGTTEINNLIQQQTDIIRREFRDRHETTVLNQLTQQQMNPSPATIQTISKFFSGDRHYSHLTGIRKTQTINRLQPLIERFKTMGTRDIGSLSDSVMKSDSKLTTVSQHLAEKERQVNTTVLKKLVTTHEKSSMKPLQQQKQIHSTQQTLSQTKDMQTTTGVEASIIEKAGDIVYQKTVGNNPLLQRILSRESMRRTSGKSQKGLRSQGNITTKSWPGSLGQTVRNTEHVLTYGKQPRQITLATAFPVEKGEGAFTTKDIPFLSNREIVYRKPQVTTSEIITETKRQLKMEQTETEKVVHTIKKKTYIEKQEEVEYVAERVYDMLESRLLLEQERRGL